MKIKIINGPNINLLGIREKKIYGKKSFKKIKLYIKKKIKSNIYYYQSNSESKLIKEIQKSYKKIDFFILNLAAYSYYSISILDALLSVNIPFLEVHISNIFKREKFRKKSIFSKYSIGFLTGFGLYGYYMAIKYLIYSNNNK
ncbi:type II 3-dehydroquinate dehydratase [Candidatus Vidania fulgoroideorum]